MCNNLLRNAMVGIHKMTNLLIRPQTPDPITDWDNTPEINIVERIILGTFAPTNGNTSGPSSHVPPLTKETIYTRLVIINALFSTNAEKGCFILQDMTNAIWNACRDTNGNHTDAELAKKAENYIRQCLGGQTAQSLSQHPIQPFFDERSGYAFGWRKAGDIYTPVKELSLMSKYLHYLLEAAGSQIGFPIWDDLIRKGIMTGKSFSSNSILRKVLFGNNGSYPHSNFPDYVRSLDKIGTLLQVQASGGWSRFHVLDRLLWSIAKVADARTSSQDYNMAKLHLLMTRYEFATIVNYYNRTPQVGAAGLPMTDATFRSIIAGLYKNTSTTHVITQIQVII